MNLNIKQLKKRRANLDQTRTQEHKVRKDSGKPEERKEENSNNDSDSDADSDTEWVREDERGHTMQPRPDRDEDSAVEERTGDRYNLRPRKSVSYRDKEQ
jgi:hypothetical protein